MPNATRDYGDLRVTMTSDWAWKYNDRGTGAIKAVELYHAKSQGDLRPLGSYAMGTYNNSNITGVRGTLLVGKNPNAKGDPAVKDPTGYDMVWDDHKSKGDHDGAIWRPKAPDGYVALGDICTNSYSTPPTNLMWCVRSDLVMDSDFEPASVWDDKGSGATLYSTIWAVARPAVGIKGFEKLPVFVDTFRSDDNPNRTIPPASLAKVLTLPCPNDFTEFDPEVPKVTKDKIPVEGDTFSEKSQAQLTLPFTAFFSPTDRSCLNNISDPFVTLSKRSAWIVASAHVNDSRGQITLKTTVMRGVSKSQSEEITHSAGVEVSASYGIGGFSMGVSLNYQFTSKDSSTYTEYQESTREQTYTIPEYHATVFFIRHMWLKAHRSNGTSELCEIGFNANEDIHLVGVDLDRPS